MASLRFSSVILVIWTVASGALAAPFGIDYETDTPQELGCETAANGYFRCRSLPISHPDMEFYVLQYVPEIGFCMIKGIGNDVHDNVFGGSTRDEVDKISRQVSVKYGKGEFFDFLTPGSIWDESEDWMMGVVRGERQYAYLWQLKEPVEGISQILVKASATNSRTGYVVVEFHTPHTDDCDAVANLEASKAF